MNFPPPPQQPMPMFRSLRRMHEWQAEQRGFKLPKKKPMLVRILRAFHKLTRP